MNNNKKPSEDITARNLAEENLRKVNNTLRALSNSSQAMMHATDEIEYLNNVCKIIVEDCGHAMVWIGFKVENEQKSVKPVASAGFEEGYLESLKVTWEDNERGRGPTGTSIRTGKPARCLNMLTDPQFAPWREQALKRGYASSIVLPLIGDGETFGAITIYSRSPEAFSIEEETLLTELAGDLAYGLHVIRLRAANTQAIEALRVSEENNRLLLKYAPTAIYELDYSGPRFKIVNDAMCQMSGYSREELLGLNPFTLLDGESIMRFQERIGKIIAGEQEDENVEYGVIIKGGGKVWANLNISLTYKDGINVGALVVAHDITERRKMEEALRNANALIETITERTRVIIATMDMDYRYTYFTQSYKEEIARLIGKEIQIGTSMVEIFADFPEQQEVAVREWSQTLQGSQQDKILEFGDPDRYRRLYSVRRAPIRDDSGKIIGAGEVATDITEQEEAKKALAESEIRYQTLFSRMTEGFALHEIICDENNTPCDYRFLDVNPAFEQLTGLKREEIIGKCKSEIQGLKGDDPKWVEIYGKVALTGVPVAFENYSPALKRHYAVQSFQPEPGRFAVIFQDVSDRKNSEERQNWLASFPDMNPTPVIEVDVSGNVYYINPSAKKTFPDLALKGCDHPYLIALDSAIGDFQDENNQMVTRDVQIGEKYFRQTLSYNPISKRVRIYGVDISARILAENALRQARDELEITVQERTKELITTNEQLRTEFKERKRAEAARQESEGRYGTLFETSPDAIIVIDLDNRILSANQRAAALHGYTDSNTLSGMDVVDLILPEDRRRVIRKIRTTREVGYLRDVEYQILTVNGSLIPAELNVSIVRDEAGHSTGYLLDIRDIAERKRAAESLRLMYAYNRSLIEVSLDPLVTITAEGKIGDVNKATELVTGCTRAELIGTDFQNYFSEPEKARAIYQKVFESGTVRDYNLEIRNKNGSLTPVLYNASVYSDEAGQMRGVFAAARDITDQKQFETQLVQAEKHAVIGRMVGSITHEINNPLQTIKNCLYLIQQDVTPESRIQEPLEMAASETLRLTNLVGHLRELYRPKAGINKQSQEILDIIEEVHSLLIPHLNSARVEWHPLTGLQRCYVDCVRDQILEVFLNICMNAIEAMQNHGGSLFVDMLAAEERIAVIIKDTGQGIPEEIVQHIFEPFMTTKASGLGLGLSISYGIVQRHGGQIMVENQPGQGATFTIWLPRVRSS